MPERAEILVTESLHHVSDEIPGGGLGGECLMLFVKDIDFIDIF